SAEQAREIVSCAKYPPMGRRGAGLGMHQDDYERAPTAEKIEALNRRTMLIAQIESPAGLENADAIAALEGIDVLWIGHNDLSIQMALPAHFEHQRFPDAIKRVADACDRHGKAPGVNAGDLAMAQDWMSQGYRAIGIGGDFRFLADGLRAGVEGVR